MTWHSQAIIELISCVTRFFSTTYFETLPKQDPQRQIRNNVIIIVIVITTKTAIIWINFHDDAYTSLVVQIYLHKKILKMIFMNTINGDWGHQGHFLVLVWVFPFIHVRRKKDAELELSHWHLNGIFISVINSYHSRGAALYCVFLLKRRIHKRRKKNKLSQRSSLKHYGRHYATYSILEE